LERDEKAIRHWIERDWPRIKRRAARTGAHVVLIDEAGYLLTPLVRRTWAPRGQTPLRHTHARHRRKVSTIGGLSVSPGRRRLGWYLQFHMDALIRQQQVIDFLRHLGRHLRGPILVVWDHLQGHHGKVLRAWLRRCRRIHLESLPGCAPELNPNEYGWAYLKTGPLANDCPRDSDELHAHVLAATKQAASEQSLLRSFVRATRLSMRLQHDR
jgi:transposase